MEKGVKQAPKRAGALKKGIAITLLAVMAFAKGWEGAGLYGKTKKARLARKSL
jgi:hypothetical protein